MQRKMILLVVAGSIFACQPPKAEKAEGKETSETKEGKVDLETDEIPKDLA